MKDKIGIFIQSRMGSTRLPGKAMEKLDDKTVIEIIAERLAKIKNKNEIILVTSKNPENNILEKEANRLKIKCFRGEEENLLDRFYEASKKNDLDIIVRITGDCPFIDHKLIERGIEEFIKKDVDFLSNTLNRTFPHGLDFSIFKQKALKEAWKAEKNKMGEMFYRAFVNPVKYIRESGKFKLENILNKKDTSHIRITLDYPEDFSLIKEIYYKLYPANPDFDLNDIEELFIKEPNLLKVNCKHNEKYQNC